VAQEWLGKLLVQFVEEVVALKVPKLFRHESPLA